LAHFHRSVAGDEALIDAIKTRSEYEHLAPPEERVERTDYCLSESADSLEDEVAISGEGLQNRNHRISVTRAKRG
jgi:hypothetical protein